MRPAFVLMKVTKEGRQELAAFDFAPREPVISDEARAEAIVLDYDRRRAERWELPLQPMVSATIRLLCHAETTDPHLAGYIRAAGDQGLSQTIHCIARHLGHTERNVVLAILRAFGQLMAIDHAPWMAAFADSPDPDLRREAANALGKILEPSIPPLLDRFARDPALADLVAFGKRKIACYTDHPSEASVHELVRLQLAGPDFEDLVPSAEYVAKALDDLIKDPTAPPALRARALYVLGLARTPLPDTYLAVVQAPPETMPEEVRFEAIFALGRLRMRNATEVLLEQARGPSPRLRRTAIFALGKIGKASVLDGLLEDWDLEAGALRPAIVEAARALARFDGAPLLESALEHDRGAPSDALVFIDESGFTRGLRLVEVEAHLRSPVREARQDAALLYAFFGPPERSQPLHDLAERESDPALKDIATRGAQRLDRIDRQRRGRVP